MTLPYFIDHVFKILVGIAALCWAIYRCPNDLFFLNCKYTPYFQGNILATVLGTAAA
jgi:hypothetical protein